MKVEALALPEILCITPNVYGDARGFFAEIFQSKRYADAGIDSNFVQDNISRSPKGVLRGLHVQHPQGQGKLVQVLQGAVFDVAVDVRIGSPSFRHWVGVRLDDDKRQQLWIPPGFAHGFLVLSESALFAYKCSGYYAPEHEFSVRWDDPTIGVDWPLEGPPALSTKDANAPMITELMDRLPSWNV